MNTYILSGSRTPIGNFMGSLSSVSAPKLGATAIKSVLEKAGTDAVDEVFMGNVIQAGVGQAPARQAAIYAGLSENTPCTTINKVCGSGMQSIISGVQSIQLQENEMVLSGGMENMSLAPHLLPKSRFGYRFDEFNVKDSMVWDGLFDVYSQRSMGLCAEECTTKYNISREEQDEFAIGSYEKSQKAIKDGLFSEEIAPVVIAHRKGDKIIKEDEGPFKVDFSKVKKLRPAFDSSGSITAANASTINDGAAAIVLGGEKYKEKADFKIVSYAKWAHNPTWFTTAPVNAMKGSLEKAGLGIKDIDVFEINEAFSVVPIVAIKELNIPAEKVNMWGGAVSLGHPIACSGTRIVTTMMSILKQTGKKLGLASICIGGGEALSLIIERIR